MLFIHLNLPMEFPVLRVSRVLLDLKEYLVLLDQAVLLELMDPKVLLVPLE